MKPCNMDRSIDSRSRKCDAGQASILLVLMLSLFLLAVLAFAVDYTNIWFERQQVQTAADAACQAGAMDIYEVVSGMSLPNMGFTVGTGGSCSSYSSPGPIMCWYASKNGFNGYNGGDASVSWSFPASVSGVTAPPSSMVNYPFLQVMVSLPVKTYFSTLLTRTSSQQVAASSTCGLTEIMQGAPIVVLNPTISGALSYSGGASLRIIGGPARSIVVNSSSTTAVNCGSSGVIDTRRGGPNLSGSDVGVVGGPRAAPGPSSGCYGTNSATGLTAGFSGGTNGGWICASQSGCRSLRRGTSGEWHEVNYSPYEIQQRILHPNRGGNRWLSGSKPHKLLWMGSAKLSLKRLQGICSGILSQRNFRERQ